VEPEAHTKGAKDAKGLIENDDEDEDEDDKAAHHADTFWTVTEWDFLRSARTGSEQLALRAT